MLPQDIPDNLQPCSQNIDGSPGLTYILTPESDTRRIHMVVPPSMAIPVVFLPGIMGSNLRMTRERKETLDRKDNRAWRPDDSLDTVDRVFHPPRHRQLGFDPEHTEVEVYEWTSDGQRFDVEAAQDDRHSNVPHGLNAIPPLLLDDPVPDPLFAPDPAQSAVVPTSAAQKARRRGWSELYFDSYGSVLKELEARLNNVVGIGHKFNQIDPVWEWHFQDKPPSKWGQQSPPAPALTQTELQTLGQAWLPVHAMGYNWLKSNAESAKWVAQRIRDLKKRYEDFGFTCPGVILVTHSMGGLLARALIHPRYGALKDEVLGVVHGAQPPHGAAAAYTRIRTGFENVFILNLKAKLVREVLGDKGPKVTAVMANAPGALELLPHPSYGLVPGGPWLQVQDKEGRTLAQWPQVPGASLAEIYTAPPGAWWRLINPAWIDPAKKYLGNVEDAQKDLRDRIRAATEFAADLATTWHPQTYAHYGADDGQPAYGQVVWQVESGDLTEAGHPALWTLHSENGTGKLIVTTASGRKLTLRLRPPQDAGDGTVPAQTSGARLGPGVKVWAQAGYEHQGSYDNGKVQKATVYAVARIAAQAVRAATAQAPGQRP